MCTARCSSTHNKIFTALKLQRRASVTFLRKVADSWKREALACPAIDFWRAALTKSQVDIHFLMNLLVARSLFAAAGDPHLSEALFGSELRFLV